MRSPGGRTRGLYIWMPSSVKLALSERAAREGMSLNDCAGAVLARSFRVSFEASGRRPARAADPKKSGVVLRVPEEMLEAIRERAFRRRTNQSAEVVRALARALGVDIHVEARRRFPLGGGRRLAA